jgi:hypothetical protein
MPRVFTSGSDTALQEKDWYHFFSLFPDWHGMYVVFLFTSIDTFSGMQYPRIIPTTADLPIQSCTLKKLCIQHFWWELKSL